MEAQIKIVMNEIYIIILITIIGAAWFIYWLYTRDTYIVKINKKEIVDFKTSMELSGLPIVTFYQGSNKYNFLLDTGSNVSYVNIKSDLKVVPTGVSDTFMGSNGVDAACEQVVVCLYRNDLKYEHSMNAADLSAAFTEVKKEYGILVTGILGNDFFTKYKYCLDFKELVAYQR